MRTHKSGLLRHNTPERIKNVTNIGHFGFVCQKKTLGQENDLIKAVFFKFVKEIVLTVPGKKKKINVT